MSRAGIIYNGLHSYRDLDLTIKEKVIGNPEKEKVLVKVPFSDMEYDFSELYGEQSLTNRQLSYTFNVFDARTHSKLAMNRLKTKALNHFMRTNKLIELYDDDYPGFHFLAEVRERPTFNETRGLGTMTVVFECYRYMIYNKYEGDDIWDTFDFDFDIAQMTKFDVVGTKTILLINDSIVNSRPTVKCTAPMDIIYKDITYKFSSGMTQSVDFRLSERMNELRIVGNGTIEFLWHKELI